jgi:hypothetical protein
MKKSATRLLPTLFACALLVCGCATPKFEAYHGSEIFQGKGGEVHSVEGMDFWENGDPVRKYRILGIVGETPRRRLPLGRVSRLLPDSGSGDRESAIAKVARKQGGDAVVIVAKTPEPSPDAEETADGNHGGRSRRRFTYVVIKYVE